MQEDKPIIEFKIEVAIESDNSGFHAYCPALEGLHTCGDTEEEALNNAVDAAAAYLKSLIKHGDPIPVGIDDGSEYVGKGVSRFKSGNTHYHTKELAIAAT